MPESLIKVKLLGKVEIYIIFRLRLRIDTNNPPPIEVRKFLGEILERKSAKQIINPQLRTCGFADYFAEVPNSAFQSLV